MQSKPANIYEASGITPQQEDERLASFELPTLVSKEAIGPIQAGASFIDIGAGSNTALGIYIRETGSSYTALDKNRDFLEQQQKVIDRGL